jgi:hypothetical protein
MEKEIENPELEGKDLDVTHYKNNNILKLTDPENSNAWIQCNTRDHYVVNVENIN